MKIRKPVEDKSIKGIKPAKTANVASQGQHRRPINKHGNRHNGPQESLNPPFEKL